MHLASILFIAISITLIAVGRHHVRRGRKLNLRSRTAAGWSLTFLGALAMLAGVLLW